MNKQTGKRIVVFGALLAAVCFLISMYVLIKYGEHVFILPAIVSLYGGGLNISVYRKLNT